MPKYSIITPMYNSFDLMERYFASLEKQTYQNFEVIIVDDCSTDGSYEKLIAYAAQSPLQLHPFKVEKNSGPGNARNVGMDHASGEWITFVDNDDWVDVTLFEKIEAVLGKHDVNCVIYDYCIQSGENTSPARSMYVGESGVVSMSDCMKYARNHTVGKFYKLESCRKHNIRYPNLRKCEDVGFVIRAIDACGSAYYLREPLYFYYQRPSSLSNNQKLDETDMIKAFAVLEEALGDKYPVELTEKSVSDLLYGVLLMMCKSGKSNKEIKSYIDTYERKYPNWSKSKIIGYMGKSKAIFLKCAQLRAVLCMKALAYVHTILVSR